METVYNLNQLLRNTERMSEKDNINVMRIISLYPVMKKDNRLHNVTEILVSARYIYSRYYLIERGCVVIYEDDYGDEEEIIYLASLYLAMCIWHSDFIDCIFWRLMDTHIDPGEKYSRSTVRNMVRHVFTQLGGFIMRPPLIYDQGLKYNIAHTLLLWFTGYRYASFLEPITIVSALKMIVYDLEHPRGKCLQNPMKEVNIVCQIMVKYFGTLVEGYADKPDTQISATLSSIKSFWYYDVEDDLTCISSTDSSTSEEGEYEKNHSNFECISVLSQRKDPNSECKVSSVYRGINRESGERFCIKRYATEAESKIDYLYIYVREVAILCALHRDDRHICVATDIGFCEEHFGYIYMKDNSVGLLAFIKQNKDFFAEGAMESLFHDMIMCMVVCASHDITHNDVKPDNFIVDDGHVKLIDFGLATCFFSYMPYNTDNIQTVAYRAPELILGDMHYSTHATDIWALGCSLYEISTEGKVLFSPHKKDDINFSPIDLTLISRNVQLTIIMTKSGLGYDSKEWQNEPACKYLRRCPLWDKCIQSRKGPLNGNYRPIDWSRLPLRLSMAIQSCLSLLPSQRPTASVLLEESGLSRIDSLF